MRKTDFGGLKRATESEAQGMGWAYEGIVSNRPPLRPTKMYKF